MSEFEFNPLTGKFDLTFSPKSAPVTENDFHSGVSEILSTETLVIRARKQMIVFGELIVSGELILEGDLWVS